MKEQIESVLEAIRPVLMADGGNVELVGVEGGTVKVRLQGACGTCPSSTYTLKLGIERMIKEQVPGVEEVVAV
ncbi:MAG: NifU family protein [Nitrospirota bacterium]|jgi:Fe-S cluster biogenesis protein NfuA